MSFSVYFPFLGPDIFIDTFFRLVGLTYDLFNWPTKRWASIRFCFGPRHWCGLLN